MREDALENQQRETLSPRLKKVFIVKQAELSYDRRRLDHRHRNRYRSPRCGWHHIRLYKLNREYADVGRCERSGGKSDRIIPVLRHLAVDHYRCGPQITLKPVARASIIYLKSRELETLRFVFRELVFLG